MSEFVYTGSECRAIDQLAMRRLQLSEMQLMQRAAGAAFDVLQAEWPMVRRVAVYCGPGNNGGDGYLVAARLARLGYQVNLFTLGSPGSETAQAARSEALAAGLTPHAIDAQTDQCLDPGSELIVDALFGHGLARDIGAPLKALFEALNRLPAPIFALDMPSGINSDSGAVMGVALRAVVTSCFVAPKIGLLTGDGVDYAGRLFYHDLGISARVAQEVTPSWFQPDDRYLGEVLPSPVPSSHKGVFGHAAVCGGQPGMPGAVMLAGIAAARSGAGRVTVLTSQQHSHLVPLACPVLMTRAIADDAVVAWPASVNALALGTGLGTNAPGREKSGDLNWSKRVFEQTLAGAMDTALPLLVDADGLNLLARSPRRYSRWVLTPHPAEAARLLNSTVDEIERDRPAACREIASAYGGVCVLKGHGSLVIEDDGRQAVCTRGNWGMATAGSGDVLSGIVVALLGQGLAPFDAACAGVYIHACAGDQAAMQLSRRAMIASDIIEQLAVVFKRGNSDADHP